MLRSEIGYSRAEGSDVAIVTRVVGRYFVPISWAIVGEGLDWQPNEWVYQRLGIMQHEPVPSTEAFTGIDDHLEMGKVMEMMKEEMIKNGESTKDLPSVEMGTTNAAPRAPSRYWVSLDPAVAISVIEGHWQTRRELESANERNQDDKVRKKTFRFLRKKNSTVATPTRDDETTMATDASASKKASSNLCQRL